MALTYVGSAEGSTTGTTAYTIDLSGLGMQQGDLVVVVSAIVSSTNQDPGVSTSGYAELCDLYADDSRDANLAVSWKLMGATPDTSVDVLASAVISRASAAVVHVWRGADQTTPIDVTTTTATGINSALWNSPSITPVTSGAVVLSCGCGTGGAVDNAITAPTGYGNQVDISAASGSFAITVGIASKAWTSGAEDPAAWTNITTGTAESWAAATVAIRPAADGAAKPVLFASHYLQQGVR